jgi:hypothetical protein
MSDINILAISGTVSRESFNTTGGHEAAAGPDHALVVGADHLLDVTAHQVARRRPAIGA